MGLKGFSLAFTGSLLLSSIGSLLAQDLSEQAIREAALKEAQNMLRSPSLRQKEVNRTPEGQKAEERLKSLGGSSQDNEEIYRLASEVFENLAKETGGDEKKMQNILKQAEKDPSSFAEKYFSDENKNDLKKISTHLPSN